METVISDTELHAFLGENKELLGFSRKALCVLLDYKASEKSSYKWPDEVIERDEKSRIVKRVSIIKVNETPKDPSNTKYVFNTYEEWTYDDNKGTAVMRRGERDEIAFTERKYQDGRMIEEVTVENLSGDTMIEFIKPLDQAQEEGVMYAVLYYRGESVGKDDSINSSNTFNPSDIVGIGEHLGKRDPVGLDDRHVIVRYWEYSLGEIPLEESYREQGISFSSTRIRARGEKGTIRLSDGNITISTEFGNVSFPKVLDYQVVFDSIRFENGQFS